MPHGLYPSGQRILTCDVKAEVSRLAPRKQTGQARVKISRLPWIRLWVPTKGTWRVKRPPSQLETSTLQKGANQASGKTRNRMTDAPATHRGGPGPRTHEALLRVCDKEKPAETGFREQTLLSRRAHGRKHTQRRSTSLSFRKTQVQTPARTPDTEAGCAQMAEGGRGRGEPEPRARLLGISNGVLASDQKV